MRRSREVPIAAAIAAVALLGGGVLLWKSRPAPEVTPSASGELEAVTTVTGLEASVYFPAASGRLERELRSPPGDLETAERKRWLAEQLVSDPERKGSKRVLPAGTQVASVISAPDGTIFVDFTISEQDANGMGSTDEMLTLYSVVNTLLLDDPSAERAVLLINGRQRETLAGHLDTSRPLRARLDLIQEPG